MPQYKHPRYGLLGQGQVGRKLIERHAGVGFQWVSNSKHLWERSDGKSLRRSDLNRILAWKTNRSNKHRIRELVRYEFGSIDDQIDLLQSTLTEPLNEWVIFDATFMPPHLAHALCRSFMGCLAYCSANKTPWAEIELCRELYDHAKHHRTLLCLNCVQGVWLDQMEYVPILVDSLEDGKLVITKRDNPSLNLFYEKIRKGISPSRAFDQIRKQGYLEPGASDLLTEVKDQWVKGRITQNFCSILSGLKLDSKNELSSVIPKTAKPEEIANQHLSARKTGKYHALTSMVEIGPSTINLGLDFVNLPATHPLARNFPGKNALCAQGTKARFTWTKYRPSDKFFVHSGFGGARRTADKLAWEANRASKLSRVRGEAEFNPIPAIWSSRFGDTYGKRLIRELSVQF